MSENVIISNSASTKARLPLAAGEVVWVVTSLMFLATCAHKSSPLHGSCVLNKPGLFRPKQIPWPFCRRNLRELLWQNPALVPTFCVCAFFTSTSALQTSIERSDRPASSSTSPWPSMFGKKGEATTLSKMGPRVLGIPREEH